MKNIEQSGLAIVLSFFLPGLGQLYAGHITRGLTMIFATLFLGATHLFMLAQDFIRHATPLFVVSAVLLAISSSIYWLWATIDAYNLYTQDCPLPTVSTKAFEPAIVNNPGLKARV